jgi:urease accessory protein
MKSTEQLLTLLQLVSPGFPIGAYNYSEGLETLINQNVIEKKSDLCWWIELEMRHGAIRVETAIIRRVYHSLVTGDLTKLNYWNNWLSAARETPELRQQNWQMGQSLLKLLLNLEPKINEITLQLRPPYNYVLILAIAFYFWEIDLKIAVISYLHTWVANLVNSGVKLIPLGQTSGQQIVFELNQIIPQIGEEILQLEDEELSSCNWGLALASMNHETLYTRLFRS